MLNPTGLIRGHYECRSFDQTLPILSDLLALEVVGESSNRKTLKHPNTDWRLVIHANGPDAPIKAHEKSLWRAGNQRRRSRSRH